ncbi:MAG: hypothetical protein HY898_02510 [Deltaproteobacteria bacterium]|nr:hypothetical protein [Deltaproteobacteria bacterium]
MASKLDDVVNNLIEGMHQISKIETVVGEPLQAGDAMLVPIHRLRVGFGIATVGAGGHSEGGDAKSGGRGVGGGVQVEPIAVVSIGKDGRPKMMAIDGESEQMLGQLFEQVPDMVGRILKLVTSKMTGSDDEPARVEAARPKARLPEKEKEKDKE